MMHITYDRQADAAYVQIQDYAVHRSQEVDVNTVIDYDTNGRIVGMELLNASQTNPELIKQAE